MTGMEFSAEHGVYTAAYEDIVFEFDRLRIDRYGGLSGEVSVSTLLPNPARLHSAHMVLSTTDGRTKLARFLLVLALAFALPVQGVAAVSAGLCMELGHHDGAATPSHAHDGGTDSAADAHCGPCVACCAAASISSGTTAFPGVPTAAEVAAPGLTAPPDFLADRLNRPPLAL